MREQRRLHWRSKEGKKEVQQTKKQNTSKELLQNPGLLQVFTERCRSDEVGRDAPREEHTDLQHLLLLLNLLLLIVLFIHKHKDRAPARRASPLLHSRFIVLLLLCAAARSLLSRCPSVSDWLPLHSAERLDCIQLSLSPQLKPPSHLSLPPLSLPSLSPLSLG